MIYCALSSKSMGSSLWKQAKEGNNSECKINNSTSTHFATADELVREYMKFEYSRSSRLKWTYKSHKVRVALIILTQDLSWFVPDFPEPLKTHICPCLGVELKRNSFDNNHSLPHMVTTIFEGSYTKNDFQLLQEII